MNSRKFVLTVGGLIAFWSLLLSAAIVTSLALGRQQFASEALLDHQFRKANGAVPDVLFVGDSSLGNAIDADLWSKLSGRTTLNMALTGYYGYAGSYHMILRVLRRGKPHTVIIMQTLDMASRQPAAAAEQLLVPVSELPLYRQVERAFHVYFNMEQIAQSVSYLWRKMRGMGQVENRDAIENDYVRQGRQLAPPAAIESLNRRQVSPASVEWLRRLGNLCKEHGLTCLYVHGPLLQQMCSEATAFTRRVDDVIRQSGLRHVAASPICMSEVEIGDSLDHVAPRMKQDFTRKYYSLLSAQLAR